MSNCQPVSTSIGEGSLIGVAGVEGQPVTKDSFQGLLGCLLFLIFLRSIAKFDPVPVCL